MPGVTATDHLGNGILGEAVVSSARKRSGTEVLLEGRRQDIHDNRDPKDGPA
jgi:hypothetical protein